MKAEFKPKKPNTLMEEIREKLDQLQKMIANVDRYSPEEIQQIPALLDAVQSGFEKLKDSGAQMTAEKGLFESQTNALRTKLSAFVRQAGGSQAFEKARHEYSPQEDHWWWHADQILAEDRRKKSIRLIRNIGIVAFLILVAGLVYQQFFAPDPTITASYRHRINAEQILQEDLDYDAALVEIQAARALTPDDPELMILEGAIYGSLDQLEKANQIFEESRKVIPKEEIFYAHRAQSYILTGQYEQAILDCQAALEINPNLAIAHLTMGTAYQELGKLQPAYEQYQLADETAQRIGDAQLQAIARVNISQVLQLLSMATPVPATTPDGNE